MSKVREKDGILGSTDFLDAVTVPPTGPRTEREPGSTPGGPSSPSPWHPRSPETHKHTLNNFQPTSISILSHYCSVCVCVLTCEHSSSAFSRAAFRWLWSGCDSGVFSKIWSDRKVQAGSYQMCRMFCDLLEWCVCVETYVFDDEGVPCDSLHGFEQKTGQRHSLTSGVHG